MGRALGQNCQEKSSAIVQKRNRGCRTARSAAPEKVKIRSYENGVFGRAGKVLLQHGNVRKESLVGEIFCTVGALAHTALALDANAGHLLGVGHVNRAHGAFLGTQAAAGAAVLMREGLGL